MRVLALKSMISPILLYGIQKHILGLKTENLTLPG